MSGEWWREPSPPNKQDYPAALPDAGWTEYCQWLLGRRRRFVVRENSMIPTLMPGDTILVAMGAPVQIGDVVICCWGDRNFQSLVAPDLLLVKRVSEIFYDGGVYLISDNANESNARDSRHFGVIEANRIIGRVTSRLASSL